jgi:hypothetical protein
MNDHANTDEPIASDPSFLALDAVLRANLAGFVRKTFATVSPGDRCLFNWHIQAICYALEKVMRGETKRLIITMPPRYLKSICASVAFPAWVLGHDPTRKIICVSYAQDLAIKHGNDCRAVMGSQWYGHVFPGTKIDPTKNTETEFMTTARGFRFSTSVGGVLTGRGGDLIIADDPMKPADANSEVARARVIDWYSGTLVSRLNDKANWAIIVVAQRLHDGDLIGHLLQEDNWTHLNLPAIAELEEQVEIGPGQFHSRHIGDLLHPERESTTIVDGIKRAMGSATFAAQYQQSPVPPDGNMIDWSWFNWYRPNATPKFDRIVISWDTATKASELSDYSVATVWGELFGFCYLLDVIRERLEYPALKRKVLDLNQQWYFATGGRWPELIIEDAGIGSALIQDLKVSSIGAHAIRQDHAHVSAVGQNRRWPDFSAVRRKMAQRLPHQGPGLSTR